MQLYVSTRDGYIFVTEDCKECTKELHALFPIYKTGDFNTNSIDLYKVKVMVPEEYFDSVMQENHYDIILNYGAGKKCFHELKEELLSLNIFKNMEEIEDFFKKYIFIYIACQIVDKKYSDVIKNYVCDRIEEYIKTKNDFHSAITVLSQDFFSATLFPAIENINEYKELEIAKIPKGKISEDVYYENSQSKGKLFSKDEEVLIFRNGVYKPFIKKIKSFLSCDFEEVRLPMSEDGDKK